MTESSEVMQFSEGEEISIMRGLHRGSTAIVKGVDKAKGQYAVQLPDGSFAVINAVNVRVPNEATITAGELAQAFGSDAADVSDQVWARLEALVPGITRYVKVASV